MDARAGRTRRSGKQQFVAIVALVFALRLPFLNQAIQGDDPYYLYGAEHAQIDPLHPDHAKYLFQGDMVDMRGHPHPPLNSWILGALLWRRGRRARSAVSSRFIVLSIIAALAMWSLARRFCDRPFLATLLFLAVPAFVVNGNSLEADLPFLALWMLTVALFVTGVEENSALALIGSALAAALAALNAYQAVFLVPILAFYLWRKQSRSMFAWSVIFAAPLAIGAWQIYGGVSGGGMPAAVLWGYMQKYGWQVAAQKMKNAAALVVHSAWIVSPLLIRGNRWNWALGAIAAAGGALYDPNPMFWASLGFGVVVLSSCFGRDFLDAWVLIFFAGALVVFFAGSARYLLPIAAPVAMLAANRCSTRMLGLGFALQMMLSVGFAIVNYETWGAYKNFALSLATEAAANARLGRKRLGTSLLSGVRRRAGRAEGPNIRDRRCCRHQPRGSLRAVDRIDEIRPAIPLRLFSVNQKSAYSVASAGLWPFEFSSAPVDRVATYLVSERDVECHGLRPPINNKSCAACLQTAGRRAEATVLVKRASGPLRAEFFIHEKSTARNVKLLVDGKTVAEQTFPGPGVYSLSVEVPGSGNVTITLAVDKTFSVAGDGRQLGILIQGIGFK